MKRHRKPWLQSWYKLHDRFERFKRKLKKRLPSKAHVESSRASRVFGSTLLRSDLWSFKADPLARGLALGLFVAFTPTMGFQMFITCFLILFFPGNLPIALAACWITNPLTAGPIYYGEYRIGEWLMELFSVMPVGATGDAAKIVDIYNVAGAMWVGSVVVGIISAAAGYFLTYGLVYLERKVRFEKLLHLRRLRSLGSADNNGAGAKKRKSEKSRIP